MSPRHRASRAGRAGQGVDFLADDAAERAVYVISVAPARAANHPLTLRQYPRLVGAPPPPPPGGGRRYSHRDVEQLRRVQALSQDGVNLEGIRRILELERRLEDLERENRNLRLRQAAAERVFAAAADGEVQVVPARSGRVVQGRAAQRAEAPTAGAFGQGRKATPPGSAIVLRRM